MSNRAQIGIGNVIDASYNTFFFAARASSAALILATESTSSLLLKKTPKHGKKQRLAKCKD